MRRRVDGTPGPAPAGTRLRESESPAVGPPLRVVTAAQVTDAAAERERWLAGLAEKIREADEAARKNADPSRGRGIGGITAEAYVRAHWNGAVSYQELCAALYCSEGQLKEWKRRTGFGIGQGIMRFPTIKELVRAQPDIMWGGESPRIQGRGAQC